MELRTNKGFTDLAVGEMEQINGGSRRILELILRHLCRPNFNIPTSWC